MSRRLSIATFVLACVAWSAPLAAQSRREMQMMADIRMLQEQTQQMQQQLQAAVDAIGVTLKAISTRLDEQTAQTRKSFADQKLVVDQFGTDLRVVRERIDESNVRITALSQEVEALRLAIPEFPAAPVVPVDPNAPAGTVPAQEAPPSSPPTTATAPGSPTRMFSTALSDFTSGQWTLCIDGFNLYLKSFSRTDAADDAQQYVGECYFSDGKYTEAVDAYNRVITNFPKGDRVPEAYYKRGVALERLSQPDRARESFESVMKLFPDSSMARLAKQRIDALNRGKPPGEEHQ